MFFVSRECPRAPVHIGSLRESVSILFEAHNLCTCEVLLLPSTLWSKAIVSKNLNGLSRRLTRWDDAPTSCSYERAIPRSEMRPLIRIYASTTNSRSRNNKPGTDCTVCYEAIRICSTLYSWNQVTGSLCILALLGKAPSKEHGDWIPLIFSLLSRKGHPA